MLTILFTACSLSDDIEQIFHVQSKFQIVLGNDDQISFLYLSSSL